VSLLRANAKEAGIKDPAVLIEKIGTIWHIGTPMYLAIGVVEALKIQSFGRKVLENIFWGLQEFPKRRWCVCRTWEAAGRSHDGNRL
jgi:hypothetical protein